MGCLNDLNLNPFKYNIGEAEMRGVRLTKLNPNEINTALEQMSIILAEMVRDVEVRRFIKNEVGKRFDGDYNALYKSLKFFKFSDRQSFEERLVESYIKIKAKEGEIVNRGEAILRVKNLVDKIPRFQVSVPVNFERWDVENYVPLVAYYPVGIDDKLVKYVKAFDSSGKEYFLDNWSVPDFPVIVLGVSERTNDEGNVIYRGFDLPNFMESEPGDGGGGGGGGVSSNYKLKVVWFRLNNDNFEGVFGGAPEFYIHITYWDVMNNNKFGPIRTDFYDIKSQGRYYVARTVYNAGSIAPNLLNDSISVEVWEDDGGWLGKDDEVEKYWCYPLPSNSAIYWLGGESIPVFSNEKWYYGSRGNVDLTLVWAYE